MRIARRVLVRTTAFAGLFALLWLHACSKSPTEPSDGGSPTLVQGQTVNALDGQPRAGLSVRVGFLNVTTDAGGMFQIDVAGLGGVHRTVISGGDIVERETHVAGGGSTRRLSVIPSSFDMTAFNEMFRALDAKLARWTSRPSLVILASVMNYEGMADTYAASSEQLSDDEVQQLIAHVTEGLALLTGNTYASFASVEVERPAAGTRVSPYRTGKIVIGRYHGVTTVDRTIGYGQWGQLPDGTIVSGAAFLDRDFDKNDSRRRLLRIHELGHTLGYQHVESRTSIMNPAVGPEPNDFDRAGASVAFQRPIGNRAPDVDPESAPVTASTGAPRWSSPTICR